MEIEWIHESLFISNGTTCVICDPNKDSLKEIILLNLLEDIEDVIICYTYFDEDNVKILKAIRKPLHVLSFREYYYKIKNIYNNNMKWGSESFLDQHTYTKFSFQRDGYGYLIYINKMDLKKCDESFDEVSFIYYSAKGITDYSAKLQSSLNGYYIKQGSIVNKLIKTDNLDKIYFS